MAQVDNLIFQSSETTGTGSKAIVSLGGFRSFVDSFGTGGTDVFYYFIRHSTKNEFEWGTGHIDGTSGDLVSDTIINGSSGAGTAVNFTAGTKDITCDYPAENVNADSTKLDGIEAGAQVNPVDTDALSEGTINLYYTDLRVNGRIDARVDKAFVDALNVDADTLDGNDSSAFAQLSGATFTGGVQVSDNISGLAMVDGSVPELQDFVILPPNKNQGMRETVFRWDQSDLAYLLEDQNPTVTMLEGTEPGDLSDVFNMSASFTNLYPQRSASDNWEVEITGFSIGSSNLSYRPYLLFHSGSGYVSSIRVQVRYGGTWVDLLNETIDGREYIFPMYGTNPGGHPDGVRLRLEGLTGNCYLRAFGIFTHSSSPYQWTLPRGGGSMFGNANWKVGAPQVNGSDVWHPGNDGSGSGLDADTLDGNDSSAFLLASELPNAAVAQFTSTDNTTDFNTSTPTAVPWDTSLISNSGITQPTPSEIQVGEAGLWEFAVNLSFYEPSSLRVAPRLRYWINGVEQSATSQSSYIRAASGHDRSSTSLTAIFNLNANDVVEVRVDQAGSSGAVELIVNESLLGVKKLAGRVATLGDADTLNGKTAADFAVSGHGHANATTTVDGFMASGDKSKLNGIESGAQVNPSNTDGLSEGSTNLYYTDVRVNGRIDARVDKAFVDALNVDADTLDGVNGSNYARLDADNPGAISFSSTTGPKLNAYSANYGLGVNSSELTLFTNGDVKIRDSAWNGTVLGTVIHTGNDTDTLSEGASNLYYTDVRVNGRIDARVNKAFVDALNVDADTLDGSHASAFASSGHGHSNATTSSDGFMASGDKSKLNGIEASADVTDASNVAAAGAAMTNNNLSDVSNAATSRANLGVPTIRANGVLAPHHNLIVDANRTSADSTVVAAGEARAQADGLVVTDANGAGIRLENVDVTADITTSGANGLDTGSEAASTWYYTWVIYNGTTTAALLSTSSTFTGLTLPSGYTFAGLVGAVYNDGSSNFIKMGQLNTTAGITSQDAGNFGSAGDWDPISVTVPPIATKWHGQANPTSNTSGNAEFRMAATADLIFGNVSGARSSGGLNQDSMTFEILLLEQQTVYGNTANSGSVNYIHTIGWEL